MTSAITWTVSGILFLLSGIHIYWLLGGRFGSAAVIPSRGNEALFRPSKTATGIVAAVLALAGWFVMELGGGIDRILFAEWLLAYGGWFLSGVFILRAVGDFRLMGFFKRVQGTLFAKFDTLLYSPLCLFIGISILIVTTQ